MGARVKVRDRELSSLPGESVTRRLQDLARGATGVANGEIRDLERAIRVLEISIGHGSARVIHTALAAGTITETPEIVQLLMLDRRRALLTGE